MRNDFDYQAQCGVWQCCDCAEMLYPSELLQGTDIGEPDRENLCPSCFADAEPYVMGPPTESETEIHTWFERDRAYVELRDSRTDETLQKWWDDKVQEAIEDGFLDPKDYHGTAYQTWKGWQ